jgi:GDPmannose 4,6-dehydratase
MKALIFGANGQDGYYLNQLLLDLGLITITTSRKNTATPVNVSNYKEVADIIKREAPEYIFNFAANSSVNHDTLFENHETIATGTLNILEAVKQFSPYSKIFIAGSGLQFKNEGKPISETNSFEAQSPYAIARIQSTYAARYFRSIGIHTYVGYLFNHDSPLRTSRHLSKKITEAVTRISKGSNEKIEIGDYNVVKEYGYAKDIVAGIWHFVNQDAVHEANISTGIGYSIAEWLQECFNLVNLKWEDYVIENKHFTPTYKTLVSNASLIQSIGWSAKTSFKQLAQKMMFEHE